MYQFNSRINPKCRLCKGSSLKQNPHRKNPSTSWSHFDTCESLLFLGRTQVFFFKDVLPISWPHRPKWANDYMTWLKDMHIKKEKITVFKPHTMNYLNKDKTKQKRYFIKLVLKCIQHSIKCILHSKWGR